MYLKLKKVTVGIAIILGVGYGLTVFTEIPYLSSMRNIWIETALTTGDHQWLATSFIPKSVIDKVMAEKIETTNVISVTSFKEHVDIGQFRAEFNDDGGNLSKGEEASSKKETANNGIKAGQMVDLLNQKYLGDTDEFGNKILVNDIEQGIVITEIKSITYNGQLVMIDDPSRVIVGQTDQKGIRGKLITDYLKDYDAVVGINANGFPDPDGSGSGGDILGRSLSAGEEWGEAPREFSTTIGLDDKNRLVVGHINDWEKYSLRDAAQFKPVLIADGKIITTGSAGWGIHPRTVVGQRSDGVIVFMVVDGRQPGHSIGITVGEVAEILFKYGVVNAAACDGGSSSVLAYDGKIMNKPSTPMEYGRYLPNAFLVKAKH